MTNVDFDETYGIVEKYSVHIVSFDECRGLLEQLEINYDGEIDKNSVIYPKIETQNDCIAGYIALPKIFEKPGSSYKLQFFVSKKKIVIADDDDNAEKLVKLIRQDNFSTRRRERSCGQFVYQLLINLMRMDSTIFERYEQRLTAMEEDVMNDNTEDFQDRLLPIRKDLLTLRTYYGHIADMAEELEDNGDMFFPNKDQRLFTIAMDRANRYKDRAIYLLDYANQVREAFQATVAEKQNSNMEFLTILSTIFFPLTLITGWYGMNFVNMPELTHGYPYVICLSVVIVLIIIFIFKKKKIL